MTAAPHAAAASRNTIRYKSASTPRPLIVEATSRSITCRCHTPTQHQFDELGDHQAGQQDTDHDQGDPRQQREAHNISTAYQVGTEGAAAQGRRHQGPQTTARHFVQHRGGQCHPAGTTKEPHSPQGVRLLRGVPTCSVSGPSYCSRVRSSSWAPLIFSNSCSRSGTVILAFCSESRSRMI